MSVNYRTFCSHLDEYEDLTRRIDYIEREREQHLTLMKFLYKELTPEQQAEVESNLEQKCLDLVFQS
jgi:Spy/CpxP family protein refolding chaperone